MPRRSTKIYFSCVGVSTVAASVETLALREPERMSMRKKRIEGMRLGGRREGVWELIDIDQIQYAFQGSDAACRLVSASWSGEGGFAAARVYVRTDDGVFRTKFRSLQALRRQLSDAFEAVNRGLLVNLDLVRSITASRELGLIINRGEGRRLREWLHMSRRGGRRVRARLGLGSAARGRPRGKAQRPGSSAKRPDSANRVDVFDLQVL